MIAPPPRTRNPPSERHVLPENPAHPAIDDLSQPFPQTPRGTRWSVVTDGVMGGLSAGSLARTQRDGRPCLRLTGDVSLANDGGFLQAALDLAPGAAPVDAAVWSGIALTVAGPPETYNLHLRTTDITRPWQSYRAGFTLGPAWAQVRLPWSAFVPHRTDAPFAPARLRRIGLVAIGRAFHADLFVGDIRFFRTAETDPPPR